MTAAKPSSLFAMALLLAVVAPTAVWAGLRAGAYAADVTPETFPVICNGNFTPLMAGQANGPMHARCLVLDDGTTKVAVVVVDTCLLPERLVKQIKERASRSTGIPVDRMSISATHTHTAPSLTALAGVPVDPHYPALFLPRVVEGIERAAKNLKPAKAGWAVAKAPEHTHCRQWIYRPDRMLTDPYGGQTVRVNMHPGYQNASTIGPSGPADPDLSLLSLQTPDGRPVAVLANFSMHYFGAAPVSADYFGLFCRTLQERLAPGDQSFMVALSQGTSGDLHWYDYGKPDPRMTMERYTEGLVRLAEGAYRTIRHAEGATVAMAEADLRVKVNVPDEARLAWARKLVDTFKGRLPQTWPEAYAEEALLLHKERERDVKLQVIRVGELGITTTSCEMFGLTGLKIKAQSPLAHTFNVELANDVDGYLPPRELHPLGGYTTWPSRWAGLEPGAEEKITDGLLGLLEKVSGKPRKRVTDTHGPYAEAVLASKPAAYWRLNEWGGPALADAAGGGSSAAAEDGVLFYLEGPDSPAFSGEGTINRSPHFAGGRMAVRPKELGPAYSVELWFWNGLANEARQVTGYLLSRGESAAEGAPGDHLALGGTATSPGRLVFFNGNKLGTVLTGNATVEPKTWNHVVYVRDGKRVAVYLNGNPEPDITGEAEVGHPSDVTQLFLGGRNDNLFNFEGRIDEAALYDRALTAEEAEAHFRAVPDSLRTDAGGRPAD